MQLAYGESELGKVVIGSGPLIEGKAIRNWIIAHDDRMRIFSLVGCTWMGFSGLLDESPRNSK
jgi:hypothetical protein